MKEQDVIEACKQVVDPEIGIDIWTLGLIYEHKLENNNVYIKMTFTTPACPFGPMLVEDLEKELKKKGAKETKIDITFEPAWKPSEELREMLGV